MTAANFDTILRDVLCHAVGPALDLLPTRMDSARARVQLLAIGMQESRFEHRVQIGGPARGFWQFERGGGVKGVLTHPLVKPWATAICASRDVEPSEQAVYDRLPADDVLATAFARLLLWTDPGPLPALGDAEGAWGLYVRAWRPGKPHRDTWDAFYQQALAEIAKDA